MPYFWLKLLALWYPDLTCSPCRWRKLLNVDAADRASETETDDGFLWKSAAVRSAACFCSVVVPSVGGGVEDWWLATADLPSLANLFCNSLMWPPPLPLLLVVVGGGGGGEKAPARGGGAGLLALDRVGGAGADFPMPSADTETPAAPSLFIAFWFR